MKVTFLGATHEVTGSCTLIEAGGKYGLVDYGMEQGKDIFENQKIPVDPSLVDFILLTHAHIDHSGNIPLFFKNGFRGPVYATESTCNLCSIMLRDSAHIQMTEADWRNRKAKRSGEPLYQPIYDMDDVEAALQKFRPCDYESMIQINENIAVRFTDAGHLLGSANIEIWITEGDVKKKITFSGDLGNHDQPIICNPTPVDESDYVVIESTYGDRYHGERPDYVQYLTDCIQRTLDRGGNVVIPSFAVGRTQELLYFIREIKDRSLVTGHGNFPVYIDSPLAIEATGIFVQCDRSYLNDDMKKLLASGVNPIMFPGLKLAVSSEESKAINFDETPKVIISASGMCEAGRIRHHLKHNLWRSDSLILFVGYQVAGTLGRMLHDGAKSVKLFGEEITVNAEVTYLPGKSGHADKQGLLDWITAFKEKPYMTFVNHGENTVCEDFAACLNNEYSIRAYAPYSGTVFDLEKGVFIQCPEGIPVEQKSSAQERASAVYKKLMAAGEKLLAVIKKCKGGSTKDLAKFTSQIEALCSKWDK